MKPLRSHESHTCRSASRALFLARCTPLLLVAGCGDYSGQREPVPPPPSIAAGSYASRDPDPLWIIDLPQGGRTREAIVRRCDPDCIVVRLPARVGLNGLSIAVPPTDDAPAVDLAVTVVEGGVRLSSVGPDGMLTETTMVPTNDPASRTR